MLDGSYGLAASTITLFFSEAGPWALVVFGIGLVIFVHELGHFWAAKICRVRAEIFSLGFGPRLFGIKRGETDYRVSLVPLGGYVKMAGETRNEELRGEPYELMSKPVGQRLFIFSAGVAMNMVFAILVFPIVFSVGVPFIKPEIGTVEKWVDTGTESERLIAAGPAWVAGLEPGDEVLRIGDDEIFDYTNILTEVTLGDPHELTFVVRRAGVSGGPPRELHIPVYPAYSRLEGRYVIGVGARTETTIMVDPGGPAAEAGMMNGDRVVAVNGKPVSDHVEVSAELYWREQVTFTVERDGSRIDLPVMSRPAPAGLEVGIGAVVNHVAGDRGSWQRTLTEEGGSGGGVDENPTLRAGDRILSARATRDPPPASPIASESDWVAAVRAAAASGEGILVTVLRDGSPRELAFGAAEERALIDDIALAPDLTSTVVVCLPRSPAERAGLPGRAQLVRVGERDVRTWDDIRNAIQELEGKDVTLAFETEHGIDEVTVTPAARIRDFGLAFLRPEVVRKFGLLSACAAGWQCSLYWTKSTYLTLKKMVMGHVSPKNLGGILSIGYVSRTYANSGIAKLLFFLAILSINLAFINFLPIPILDGGHILFLIIEKIKGSPVSERLMGYAQVVGLVLILALLFYVTYNDIIRIFVR
ncbi:MAG: RIP metalloprotease RseP [Planctomycetota bacterium]